MFTRNIKNTFTQGLLNAVAGVLGEAKKKCSEGCECEACAPEEETNEGYKLSDQLKREREAKEKKEPNGVKEAKEDVPFKGPYKKAGEERKDEYGNKVKNVAKYLAKKAMNTQKEEVEDLDEKRGLWDNIHAKRKRIKAGSGERMRKPGSEGAPSAADLKASQTEEVSVDEAFEQISEAPRVGMDYAPASEKSKFDSGHRAKLLNPEGRTSYLSQKSYKTAKHAKEAAKFYHSVAHLPMQTVDNKMSQYNKAYDAKHKMSEEVEQIDELSIKTLEKYKNAARNDAYIAYHGDDDNRRLLKRTKGIKTATKKIRSNFVKGVDEAFEQIDELSKGTLGSYVKKATNQVFGKGVTGGMALARNNADGEAEGAKLVNKAGKRMMGVQKAADKLTKEEQDFIDSLNDIDMEQIDELSKDTMLKYLSANKKSASGGMGDKEATKRMRGADMAVRKYTARPGSKVRVPASEEVELGEARGRPRKAGAKDFTINPKTKEKLMHNNPEHMKKIEALQRNGVIQAPKIEANQHIIQQLQRAKLSMRGGETINFTHGDSQHVAGHHAAKLLTRYAGMKPDEKEAFQKKIGHSHANLKSEL